MNAKQREAIAYGDETTICRADGTVISRSRNLRGIRAAVGKRGVLEVEITKMGPKAASDGLLHVKFYGGDYCLTGYASFDVLREGLRTWRNLYGVKLVINGEPAGEIGYSNERLK